MSLRRRRRVGGICSRVDVLRCQRDLASGLIDGTRPARPLPAISGTAIVNAFRSFAGARMDEGFPAPAIATRCG
jgi:hypothetical protein